MLRLALFLPSRGLSCIPGHCQESLGCLTCDRQLDPQGVTSRLGMEGFRWGLLSPQPTGLALPGHWRQSYKLELPNPKLCSDPLYPRKPSGGLSQLPV